MAERLAIVGFLPPDLRRPNFAATKRQPHFVLTGSNSGVRKKTGAE